MNVTSYATPSFETRTEPDGKVELTVRGALCSAWARNLAYAFAHMRIDVRRGHAVRTAGGHWMGRLELMAPARVDVRALDYAALCEQQAYGPPGVSLQIEQLRFASVDDHGGSLRLGVREARDCVGLLAALLGYVELLGLVPVELALETHGGRVFDDLWLRSSEGGAPAVEVPHLIARRLAPFLAA